MHARGDIRCLHAMLPMRDGARLNTFVYLPADAAGAWPVIVQRTPYGITAADAENHTDCARGWLPDPDAPMRGSILRGYRNIAAHGYVAVYQDTRGRYGSEGEDRVYADDALDGYDTLEWIARQSWCNGRIGMSGSSAAATTTFAAASQGHPALQAFFAQVGGSSIYDDVVYEGNAIELERLWLWVARNIPGLSRSHREAVMRRSGLMPENLERIGHAASERCARLEAASRTAPPFIGSDDWMHLPLLHYPDFATWQPFLDEILSHPASDAFRARHDFRRTIAIPGFHATTWYDIFQTSVIAAFNDVQARVGNQLLWIGPNHHYFIYEANFWPRDPYFEWFDHWLKGEPNAIMEAGPVHYSPRAWVEDTSAYAANDWRCAAHWPPRDTAVRRYYLCGDGSLSAAPAGEPRSYRYDPRFPIPTLGGRNMLIEPGPRDQRPARALDHYGLVYRSAPLSADTTIAGEVSVTLHVESDCADTDFVAKLIEVGPDGRALLLMDGVVRAMYRDRASESAQPLAPGEVVRMVISLAHIHHTIRAGHRIEVDITSSNFPRRARNTNSGHPLLAADTAADIRVARNVVHHARETPSHIDLPCRPAGGDSPD